MLISNSARLISTAFLEDNVYHIYQSISRCIIDQNPMRQLFEGSIYSDSVYIQVDPRKWMKFYDLKSRLILW